MKKFLYVGRQLSLGGVLRFEAWKDKDGNLRSTYKLRLDLNSTHSLVKIRRMKRLLTRLTRRLKTLFQINKTLLPMKYRFDMGVFGDLNENFTF